MRNLYKQRDKGRGGEYSLRYMKLQQGMSIDFSLFGFCELFVKMGIEFKYLIFNREWFILNKHVTTTFLLYSTSPEKKLKVINFKLFCKVVTNQSATAKLRKCINVPAL